jgi:hypothetical protein
MRPACDGLVELAHEHGLHVFQFAALGGGQMVEADLHLAHLLNRWRHSAGH